VPVAQSAASLESRFPGLSQRGRPWLLELVTQPGTQGLADRAASALLLPQMLCAPGYSPITWRWSVRAEALHVDAEILWPAGGHSLVGAGLGRTSSRASPFGFRAALCFSIKAWRNQQLGVSLLREVRSLLGFSSRPSVSRLSVTRPVP